MGTFFVEEKRILIVDDDVRFRDLCRDLALRMGLITDIAGDGLEALELMQDREFDLSLVDLKMPRMGGIDFLCNARDLDPDMPVIIITGYGSIETAVEAMKLGATDYIVKPSEISTIRDAIQSVLQKTRDMVSAPADGEKGRFGIIGNSPTIQPVYRRIEAMCRTDNTVLIMGESGVGKELVAKAIHYWGDRAEEPFIPIDCSSLSLTVVESELFGHVKGSFTDAHYTRTGLLKLAGRGTVFLDEITEIPLPVQAKLLRAIQEREVRPVGGTSIDQIEARIVAATNRELKRAVQEGKFREDLFYRLHVIPISVPPLRDRIEDIASLVQHFIEKYNTEKRHVKGITEEALNLLMRHRWEGNVRELENVIQAAIALGAGDWITHHDLSAEIRSTGEGLLGTGPIKSLRELERDAIVEALRYTAGSKLDAARMLGIGKTTLYEKIKKYNIDVPMRT
jgi:two-component system response regulator AtoC